MTVVRGLTVTTVVALLAIGPGLASGKHPPRPTSRRWLMTARVLVLPAFGLFLALAAGTPPSPAVPEGPPADRPEGLRVWLGLNSETDRLRSPETVLAAGGSGAILEV